MTDTTALDNGDIDSVAEYLVQPGQSQTDDVADDRAAYEADAPEEQVDDAEDIADAEEVDAAAEESETAEEYEDSDAEDAVEEQTYAVKVDGREQSVTLDELRRGYAGQKYIQQRMEEVADGRKEVESLYQRLQQETQQVAALRQQLETGMFMPRPTPPDKSLRESDPIGYTMAKDQFEDDLAAWQAQMQQLGAVDQRQQEQERQALAYQLQHEMAKLQQAIPEFADPVKGAELKTALVETGAAYGYAPEEIGAVVDSRAVQILHDAMRYRQMTTARGQAEAKVKSSRPVTKPGVKRSGAQGKAKKAEQVKRQMRSTGSVDDVASYLLS